jgi:hypothetical protein
VVILGKRLPNYQGLISGIPIHSDRRTSRKNLRWIRESSIKPNGTLTASSRQK